MTGCGRGRHLHQDFLGWRRGALSVAADARVLLCHSV
jgi:hypothetical protein